MEDNNYNGSAIQDSVSGISGFFTKVFLNMFIGLLLTGIVAYGTYASGLYIDILSKGLFSVVLIAELAAVLVFTFLFKKLSPAVTRGLFIVYAILTGVCFSTILAVYEMQSVYMAFFSTSLVFGAMALYGSTTKTDITRFGPLFMITLVVGIIVSVVNLFIGNPQIDTMVSWVMLVVFIGITAYDMQKLKVMYNEKEMRGFSEEKLHIYGAMELYLDFINIFLRIISLFGKRR